VAVDSGRFYHRWIKWPGTITLHFGPVIEPGLPRAVVEERVTDAINALNRA
jgi:1-acyl-sn-glycerol-3-phosphate acyltransferase